MKTTTTNVQEGMFIGKEKLLTERKLQPLVLQMFLHKLIQGKH
jgi:hypothetical protein